MRSFEIWKYFLILLLVPALHGGESNEFARRPLDLPSGGRGADSEDEEIPETIVFYGDQYEGNAFFWVLDRSGSMMLGGRLDGLKEEMISAIDQLSSTAEFGMVSFSWDFDLFSPLPVRATSHQRLAAAEWVHQLTPSGPTFLLQATEECLALASMSHRNRRAMIIVGDGEPSGPGIAETLEGIISANAEMLPINTILVGDSNLGFDFFNTLAGLTGGNFRHHP